MSLPGNRFGASGCLAGGVAVLLLGAGPVFGEEETPSPETQISDSSDERTPAITSFPAYPKIARRDRIEGDATVCFRIDTNGRIRSVQVKSYTHRIFRRPAIRAIKDSSFEPLAPEEYLSRSRTCRTYRFRLEPIVADAESEKGD